MEIFFLFFPGTIPSQSNQPMQTHCKKVSLKKEILHDATYLPVYFWKQKQEVLLKMLR